MINYYSKMAAESDAVSNRKLEEKLQELKKIFSEIKFGKKDVYELAVLGCGDGRHLEGNKRIFEQILGTRVNALTYDIEIEHLNSNAIKHDCIEPLPGTDFDITYAHVLLKFIPREKQIDLIKNSYDALAAVGIAIHVIDSDDVRLSKQGAPLVDYESIIKFLTGSNITYIIVQLKYGFALVLIKE